MRLRLAQMMHTFCDCGAPLLSRDERVLALCRDCERTDEALLLDYIEHVERSETEHAN